MKTFLWSTIVTFFSYQMLLIIFPYTSWEWDVDFLQTKQAIIHLDYYRVAFYTHIFTSLFVLLCGAILFSKKILKTVPLIHRQVGKTYVFLLLVFCAPSGMVMAFFANGGPFAKISFMILTPLWWFFTWKGYQTARQKKFKKHRIWMMRSYALTFSAVSLRAYQFLLNSFFFIDPDVQYILVSWISWAGNLLFIEWWLRRKNSFSFFPKNKKGSKAFSLPNLF